MARHFKKFEIKSGLDSLTDCKEQSRVLGTRYEVLYLNRTQLYGLERTSKRKDDSKKDGIKLKPHKVELEKLVMWAILERTETES